MSYVWMKYLVGEEKVIFKFLALQNMKLIFRNKILGIPEVVFGLLSRLLALVPMEAVLLVLVTALLDAGFPPAIAAKRSSLLFT